MKTCFTLPKNQTLNHRFGVLLPFFNNQRPGVSLLIPVPVMRTVTSINRCLMIVFSTMLLSNSAKASGNGPLAGENLITNLYSNVGGTFSLTDGNMVLYSDTYSNAVDNYDARKLTNPGENFGITRNNTLLAVEKRKLIRDADSVFFDMTNLKNIQYRLEIKANNLNHPSLYGFLEDAYTGARVSLNLNDTTTYTFNVTPVAASSARNRFRIIYTTLAASTLPVNFSTVTAKENFGKVLINWSVNNEFNVKRYEIESSADGRDFTRAGYVDVLQSKDKLVFYQWTDDMLLQGTRYYRIKSVDADGEVMYSETAVVTKAGKLSSFVVLSNPVQNNEVKVLFQGKAKGRYQVRITGLNGTTTFVTTTVHSGGTATYYYQLPVGTSSGIYHAEIIDSKNNRQQINLAVLHN